MLYSVGGAAFHGKPRMTFPISYSDSEEWRNKCGIEDLPEASFKDFGVFGGGLELILWKINAIKDAINTIPNINRYWV